MANTLENPTSGTRVPVVQGDRVELTLQCYNSASSPQTYELKLMGLKSDWFSVSPISLVIGPFERDSFTLTLNPPVSGKAGEHAFKVSVDCEGLRDDTFGTRNLTMVLEALNVPAEAPVKPVAVAKEPAKAIEVTEQVADSTLPSQERTEPATVKRKAPVKSQPASQPAASTPEPAAPAAPEPIPEPPAPEQEVPSAGAAKPLNIVPKPPTPAPVRNETPAPTTDVEDIIDGGLSPYEASTPVEAPKPQEDAVPAGVKQVIEDPSDRRTVALRAGETAYVRFTFTNPDNQSRTWVIDNNTIPERKSWLRLNRGQVNIPGNERSSLSFTIGAPPKTRPGIYELNFAIGRENTPLAHYRLFLAVQEEPAVALRCEVTAQTVGPGSRDLDYEFLVESTGNADTAYRVSRLDPNPPKDSRGRPKGTGDMYQSGPWRYLFDRELDTVKASQPNQQTFAIQHRLRIKREGIWWLGWWEKHKAQVRALPVTDVANGGETRNVAEVKALRWRIFPLPWFLMAPLALLLLVMVGSGAGNVRVVNAYQSDLAWFVLGDEVEQSDPFTMDVKLEYDQPFYAWNKVTRSEGSTEPKGSGTFREHVSGYGESAAPIYSVGPQFGSSGQEVKIRLVPVKTLDALRIDGATPLSTSPFRIGRMTKDAHIYTVRVPKTGAAHVRMSNSATGQSVIVWQATKPTDFQVVGGMTDQRFKTINANTGGSSQILDLVFQVRDAGSSGEDVIFFTSDKKNQIVVLRLIPSSGGAPAPVNPHPHTDNRPKPKPTPTPPKPVPSNGQSLEQLEAVVSSQALTPTDVAGLSAADKRLLLNWIFAKHGAKFTSADLTAYFSKFSWYQPSTTTDAAEQAFNDQERSNFHMLAHLLGRE